MLGAHTGLHQAALRQCHCMSLRGWPAVWRLALPVHLPKTVVSLDSEGSYCPGAVPTAARSPGALLHGERRPGSASLNQRQRLESTVLPGATNTREKPPRPPWGASTRGGVGALQRFYSPRVLPERGSHAGLTREQATLGRPAPHASVGRAPLPEVRRASVTFHPVAVAMARRP